MSGWNSSLIGVLPTKKKWTTRGLILGTGLILVAFGLFRIFVFDRLEGFYELSLGTTLILIIWPFVEWAMKQKALMGTSIDIVDIQKGELLRLVDGYLRSRGFKYRPNQENFIIMKGDGFELLDTLVRLTVFEVKPMHISSDFPSPKRKKASRLGIRNIDSNNVQTAIPIQIDIDKLFTEIGIKGSPPKPIPVIYRWNGKGYDTVV